LWVDRPAARGYAKRAEEDTAMASQTVSFVRTQPAAAAAVAIAVIGVATILGAYYFQFVLGYPPCPLCLEQRFAYYFAIPLAAMILLGISVGSSRKVLVLALSAIAVAMLWNAGLGAYHSGVEWHWWPGPQDCSGATPNFSAGGSLLDQINRTRVVRCDEAAWRFLGLSLAGYNVLISLALAAIAACGVWGLVRGTAGSSR
jgi:disulfide bond formation protein DsbB